MRLIGVYGASGFGREVLPVAREMLQSSDIGEYELVFVDDGNFDVKESNGHRVLSYQEFRDSPAPRKSMTFAIASGAIRETLVEKVKSDGIEIAEVIARNAVLLDAVELGEGAIICPFATVTSNVRIGRNFHANIYSYVAHDCVIGDYVTFAPGVKCNGNVHIGDHAYIGTGAIIKQGRPDKPLTIGAGAVIGMGAVVTKDVAPGVTMIGNPARPMER